MADQPEQTTSRFVPWGLAGSMAFAVLFAVLAWFSVQGINPLWDEMNDHRAAITLLQHPLVGSGLDASQARLPCYVTAYFYTVFGPSLDLARLVSIVFAAGAVMLTGYLGWRWFNLATGLLASGLLAFSPYFLGFGRTAFTEGDAFCPLFVLLAVWAFVYYLRQRNTERLTLFALALGLALATKFYSVMLIPAFVIFDYMHYRMEVTKSTPRHETYPTIFWAAGTIVLQFLAMTATQLRMNRLAAVFWIIGLTILVIPFGELLLFPPRQRRILKPGFIWSPLWGWLTIICLACAFCLAFFPEHVLQIQVPRALYRQLTQSHHAHPMTNFIDPARLYLGIILLKLNAPLGFFTLAALVWAWIRSPKDALIRLLLAVVIIYILLLTALPIRQTFYLMSIYPLLILLLSAFVFHGVAYLQTRKGWQSAWIAAIVTSCLFLGWNVFRVYPQFGYFGYEMVGNRWLGAQTRGYRNLVQVTNDGTVDILEWCRNNIAPDKRVVSYLWDNHVIDHYQNQHKLPFELIQRDPQESPLFGPPLENADYLIISLNNRIYKNVPTKQQLQQYFEPVPDHVIWRGKRPYRMPVAWVYRRRAFPATQSQPITAPADSPPVSIMRKIQ